MMKEINEKEEEKSISIDYLGQMRNVQKINLFALNDGSRRRKPTDRRR
jgi:hypothetical protein